MKHCYISIISYGIVLHSAEMFTVTSNKTSVLIFNGVLGSLILKCEDVSK